MSKKLVDIRKKLARERAQLRRRQQALLEGLDIVDSPSSLSPENVDFTEADLAAELAAELAADKEAKIPLEEKLRRMRAEEEARRAKKKVNIIDPPTLKKLAAPTAVVMSSDDFFALLRQVRPRGVQVLAEQAQVVVTGRRRRRKKAPEGFNPKAVRAAEKAEKKAFQEEKAEAGAEELEDKLFKFAQLVEADILRKQTGRTPKKGFKPVPKRAKRPKKVTPKKPKKPSSIKRRQSLSPENVEFTESDLEAELAAEKKEIKKKAAMTRAVDRQMKKLKREKLLKEIKQPALRAVLKNAPMDVIEGEIARVQDLKEDAARLKKEEREVAKKAAAAIGKTGKPKKIRTTTPKPDEDCKIPLKISGKWICRKKGGKFSWIKLSGKIGKELTKERMTQIIKTGQDVLRKNKNTTRLAKHVRNRWNRKAGLPEDARTLTRAEKNALNEL